MKPSTVVYMSIVAIALSVFSVTATFEDECYQQNDGCYILVSRGMFGARHGPTIVFKENGSLYMEEWYYHGTLYKTTIYNDD